MQHVFTVVPYCNDCDIEWEHEIDPDVRNYTTICPKCGYQNEVEFDPEDYKW